MSIHSYAPDPWEIESAQTQGDGTLAESAKQPPETNASKPRSLTATHKTVLFHGAHTAVHTAQQREIAQKHIKDSEDFNKNWDRISLHLRHTVVT